MRRSHLLIWILGLMATAGWGNQVVLAADAQAIMQVLEQRRCEGCKLQDAALVHADLRDARLRGASLQRANLSGAILDGADLSKADLSYASLAGASLRGANLTGALLIGTDLRRSDVSNAQIDTGSLIQAHWELAKGIDLAVLSYAEMQNAGFNEMLKGNFRAAEIFFSGAIQRQPNAAISWAGRGAARAELFAIEGAKQDLLYAAQLRKAVGDTTLSEELTNAAKRLDGQPSNKAKTNGTGIKLAEASVSIFKLLAPIALKALIPATP